MTKMIQFELRKIFSKRLTQIALIMILVFSAVLGFSSFQNKYAFDGISKEGSGKTAVEIDKEIAVKYEGLLTDEKVRQMMNDFSSNTDLHGMNAAYLYHNAMQSAVFTRFSDTDGNWNGSSVADVFGGESIKIGYVDGWLTTSQNMVKIFLILSLVVVIMIAPVFCSEYGGVDNIILTSKYGRTKCSAAKVGAGLIAAFIVTLAVVASAAAYFFPMILPLSETNPLFRYIGLLPMYHAQFVSLMSVEQMSNGVFYAVWAIPAAIIFVAIGIIASRRVFAKHQVS